MFADLHEEDPSSTLFDRETEKRRIFTTIAPNLRASLDMHEQRSEIHRREGKRDSKRSKSP